MLDKDLRVYLAARGRDDIRAILASVSADGNTGTSRETRVNCGDRTVRRGDLADWLHELDKAQEAREQRTFRYVQWTFWAAVIAAGVAVVGVLATWLH